LVGDVDWFGDLLKANWRFKDGCNRGRANLKSQIGVAAIKLNHERSIISPSIAPSITDEQSLITNPVRSPIARIVAIAESPITTQSQIRNHTSQ
jgi:hypothetical protein